MTLHYYASSIAHHLPSALLLGYVPGASFCAGSVESSAKHQGGHICIAIIIDKLFRVQYVQPSDASL